MSLPDINAGAWYLQARPDGWWDVCEPTTGEPLAEVTADQWDDLNQAAYLLMVCGDKQPIMALLQQLPADARIGVGVVNQKNQAIEPVDEIAARVGRAIDLFGADRLLLHPDCGFATFADNPICSAGIAEAKLAAIAAAVERFKH